MFDIEPKTVNNVLQLMYMRRQKTLTKTNCTESVTSCGAESWTVLVTNKWITELCFEEGVDYFPNTKYVK